ncbi:hypothetical protein LTR99_006061 [Exophiala xenobiotica]|uniref:NAD(P)-binding protein n=1 Tax=Vermiconidia calcicola TaxID=1690605 RepID=A0AAV9QCH4_9PEZI|nr:hypothetical protein LTR92_006049 [Exophiala xenobiotica]KAK5540867.1 hypothetical protein LTR25_002644 [Vermiconidia calcicola]KAK5549641.1 hypothetical protein LTR23_000749 [Chaetothyriales sp. CCFEE 6169]KAK5266981.1 hypothetical protein LTR96_007648 [Exophiala xenobiotica]KAK5303104.1 hypothetical protein LTR99_006061 [Exophiala xenobiotica]
MASYVVTGVSRGIGWEFLSQLSANPKNTVIGIVRNKAATDKRITEELSDRSNISIVEADLTEYEALKRAAAAVATATGGKLDYLIANAAYLPLYDQFESIGALGEDAKELTAQFHKIIDTNVLATIHLFNLFTPLILRGSVKKVITITSGLGDLEMVNRLELYNAPLYSISKAAVNMATAKFSAQYKKDGVLFLSICPGTVDTGMLAQLTPEQMAAAGALMGKFQSYAPHFKGPDTPTDAVKAVLSVIENSSIENGNAGDFVSHFGNKQWL